MPAWRTCRSECTYIQHCCHCGIGKPRSDRIVLRFVDSRISFNVYISRFVAVTFNDKPYHASNWWQIHMVLEETAGEPKEDGITSHLSMKRMYAVTGDCVNVSQSTNVHSSHVLDEEESYLLTGNYRNVSRYISMKKILKRSRWMVQLFNI